MMMLEEGWRVMRSIIHKYSFTQTYKYTNTKIHLNTNTDSGDDDVRRGLASNEEHYTQILIYTNIQIHKYKNTLKHKYRQRG